MKELGKLLSLNVGMHYTLSIGMDLVHAGRLETVIVSEDSITIVNRLGAMYRFINVATCNVVGEQEVLITYLDGTVASLVVQN